MLSILSSKKSPRFEYVCHVIFKRILGLDFFITDDDEVYRKHQEFRLRYEAKSPILFEDDIHPQDEKLLLEDKPALAFYLLSNYEEYLPDCPRDEHNRIAHGQSFVVRHQMDQKPVVHLIAAHYKAMLSKQLPDYKWIERTYRFIPTFDIDIAYAYKGKNLLHFMGALGQALMKGEFLRAGNILQARFNNAFSDPYDTYLLPKKLCKKNGLKPIYFILTSKRSQHNRNITPSTRDFQNLVHQLQAYATIGIHPSYQKKHQENIKKEIDILRSIIRQTVSCSRQHFLRYDLPDTFLQLIKADITDDYTMGFTDRIGFRNGMALPFPFFNLSTNLATQLTLHPLHMMDCALLSKNLNETEYLAQVKSLVSAVKEVNGELVANWHNTLMMEHSHERSLFEKTFELMSDSHGVK